MIMKAFTLYSLARDLQDTAPGFGVTVGYGILEGMADTPIDADVPLDLKKELQQLAEENDCAFKDWSEHRFVQFVKHERNH